jgi:tricorn protease
LAASAAESHLMRYADIHGDQIVFTYEDDLWLVDATGGTARRITSHPGVESWAKFSPDGRRIAFTAQYDGGTDIYIVDAAGGVPERLTFHPARDRMVDWYPDGQSILFRSRREYSFRAEELYRISAGGGLPERLPIDRGGLACLSPDGAKLAYNRISREARTWKRYQGGMAQDIWLADFTSGRIEKITDWVGSDNFPMWYGDGIYFISDRQDGTLNVHRYDTASGATTRLTNYSDYDVKYPSVGDGKIVFQYGETLHVLDLASGQTAKITVQIPSDLVHVRPELTKVNPRTGSFSLSPSGKRLLLAARGEILNLPSEEGSTVNLSRSSASREKNAAWSPDGRWITFVSDLSGEEEIYIVDQKGEQEWRRLTTTGQGFLLPLVWSPDSKYLLYGDKYLRLNLLDVANGKVAEIARGDYDDAWERWGIQDYVFSPDSRWIAYTKMEENLNESIYLYSLNSSEHTRVTGPLTTDWSPFFSLDGKYLYFLSNRTFEPVMGFQDQNFIFLNMGLPYVVILRAGEPSPFAEEDSVEEIDQDDGEKKDDEKSEDEKDNGKTEPTQIDLEGIDRRIVAAAGMEPGNYFRLTATEDGFLVLQKNEPEFLKYQNVNDHTTDSLDLLSYNLEDQETEKLFTGIANYHLSADGQKLVYRAGTT